MVIPKTDRESKPDLYYGHHVVAFLDLLGQKDRICEIEGILEAENPEISRDKLQKTLKHTVGTVWAFRKQFLDFFDSYLEHEPPFQIPKKFETHFKEMLSHSKINFQSFSDSTIVWTPVYLKNDLDYAKVLNSIHGILASVGTIAPLYLSKKVPFRGGIDLEGGISLYPGSNELYGPALNRAYTLESKEAEYPRVLIGIGLLNFLRSIVNIEFRDAAIGKYCQMMAERCNGWIIVDEDGRPMVHFFGASARELQSTLPDDFNYTLEILEPLKKFVLDCEDKFKDHPKLGQRYKRLKSYIDRSLKEWEM
ncbi:hypothetical protein [Bdellovibrio bacteriovorus]|uniref:Uncharacterized protein n=1 Tax=Bdellovibrio bacteriovorus str. Tiberius TaxID=1069642 RepID=K7Z9C1_BDEBC|nr:hypothetical protein [Bdellovibrio bacteriovorus]AFY01144.1 Hypothetical protein Bdt_1446 [Bdellovibrio bacteriovorus str. Tiberius]